MSGYISGDFWRICDRCGFKYRASQTSKTWDGLFVCREDFESRHPQDFVRGRMDNQNVPGARPEALDNIIGPLTTQITVAASAGTSTINVSSSVRFLNADKIGVFVDDGSVEAHIILSVPDSTTIQTTTALRGPASVGNIVIDYSAVAAVDIG